MPGKNGNKTHGRNRVFCTKYESEGRRAKNKIKKVKRHLKRIARKIKPPRGGKPRGINRDRQAENWLRDNL